MPLKNCPDCCNKVTAFEGCTSLLSFYGCSLEVCYEVILEGIKVSAVLKTPLGDVPIGSGILTPDKAEIKFGGGKGKNKAEVTISFNFDTKILRICGKISVKIPLNGMPSTEGCTEVHL